MAKKWKLLHRTLKLSSKWVTVYADKLLDDKGNELEYWHYDRADSVVILVKQGDRLVLPAPQYRVGVQEVMLDFAGSRVGPDGPVKSAYAVLERELGIMKKNIASFRPIFEFPLAVDSSFSSQKLYGYIAEIDETVSVASDAKSFKPAALRTKLHCAQCRVVLNEYLFLSRNM